MSLIQSKLDERAKIHAQMKDLVTRAQKEKRSLSADEQGQFDKIDADYKALSNEIAELRKGQAITDRFAQIDAEQKSALGYTPKQEQERSTESDPKQHYGELFNKWVRGSRLQRSDYDALAQYRGTATNVVGTQALGGYIVPEEFRAELIQTMESFGGMLTAGRIINTGTGRPMPIPTIPFAGGGESATQKGHRIGENVADSVVDIRMSEKQLGAHVYSSYEIQMSWELMTDSAFPIVPLVLSIGGERVGRIVNEELTTGTGSGQPNGVVTASTAGPTAAVSAITADDLVDLEHSVNSAYRSGGNVRFMFNDQTLAALKKLSFGSTDDRPLWVPSIREGEPDRLLGYQYTINDDMPSIGASARSVLFGDFSKYWIRQAGYPELARTDERDIGNRRSVFYVFARYDGELVDANAIKHLVHAAS